MSNEGLVLDSLDLNPSGGVYTLESWDPGIARKRQEWVQGADSDGSALVRDPLFDNATATARVRILATTMDSAIAAIGAIVDKLEECERQQDGLGLAWTPAGSSRSATGYVLSGEITDMPVDPTAGWFVSKPTLTITLTRKPFWYAAEVTGPSVSGTTPILTLDVPSVGGDVPAEARLVLIEDAGQSRRFIEWGLEQRFYNAASPSPLLIDSEDLVTTGYAGFQATRTGAYRRAGAGHDTVSSTLFSAPIAVCGLGDLPHIGTFRVKARAYCSSTAVQARLNWQDGDGPLGANDYVAPPVAGTFAELDLGTITITPVRTGTQRWTGRIEAYSPTSGDTIDIDYLVLIPCAEGYGKARAIYTCQPGAVTGHDEFPGSGAALNGRTAPAGGSWATSGAATDFTTATNQVERSTTSDTGVGRLAVLGATAATDMAVSLQYARVNGSGTFNDSVIARYVDPSNYLFAEITSIGLFVLGQYVGGTLAVLASAPLTDHLGGTISLIAFDTGRAIATITDPLGDTLATLDAVGSALTASGALASGKPGFSDFGGSGAAPRFFSNFRWGIPAPEPIALYLNRKLEVRSDETIRQGSTGVYWGKPPEYRGSRLFLPPAGAAGRTSRLVVKADRNDLESAEQVPLGDSLAAEVFYTPRFLVVPR